MSWQDEERLVRVIAEADLVEKKRLDNLAPSNDPQERKRLRRFILYGRDEDRGKDLTGR